MGKLYVVPTPVGNLEDMTFRAIRILKEADLILAEDTRTSGILLKHFEIKKPMISHHKFNEHQTVEGIVNRIKAGETIALISDAGTPAISDPGFLVVRECVRNEIEVQCLPGATAFVPALVSSGLPNDRFCFEGFLPTDKKEKKIILDELARETRTMILYEAPHHLVKTLEELYSTLGERKITLCRELTKKFETVFPTTLENALEYYKTEEPRGEYVLVLEGKSHEEIRQEEIASWETMTVEEHMAYYEAQGMDNKSAMKQVAKDRGVGKREIYAQIHGKE